MFVKYWRKYRLLALSSVLFVGLEALCDLLQPLVMARLINNGVNAGDMDYVRRMIFVMLALTTVGAVFASVRNILSSIASQRFGADVREDLFVKIQKLSVANAEEFDGGALISRLTNDANQLTSFVNGITRIFFKAPVVCVGSVILAVSISPRVAWIVLAVVFVAFAAIFLSARLSYPIFHRVQTALDKTNTTVREFLLGIRLVKAFGRADYEAERFEAANESLSGETAKANRVLSALSPVASLATNAGIALILLIGPRYIRTGEIMALISYMTQILASFGMISNLMNVFVRTRASYSRISEVMSKPDSEDFGGSEEDPNFNDMTIDIKNVTFNYPFATGEAALHDISFSIKGGETICVIGPTGSGKSSLAALLMRFYDYDAGEIRVRETELRAIPTRGARRSFAIVPQSPALFMGTIRDNIRIGKPDASDDEVRAAARIACADEFIEQTAEGYDTPLAQAGVNLSGGQKQRLSIARAIIGKPELLILDDCTSALDAITEARVMAGLREYRGGKSCLLITQRISQAMRADKILVLERGEVAGFGRHDELMENCETYRGIYRSQMG